MGSGEFLCLGYCSFFVGVNPPLVKGEVGEQATRWIKYLDSGATLLNGKTHTLYEKS